MTAAHRSGTISWPTAPSGAATRGHRATTAPGLRTAVRGSAVAAPGGDAGPGGRGRHHRVPGHGGPGARGAGGPTHLRGVPPDGRRGRRGRGAAAGPVVPPRAPDTRARPLVRGAVRRRRPGHRAHGRALVVPRRRPGDGRGRRGAAARPAGGRGDRPRARAGGGAARARGGPAVALPPQHRRRAAARRLPRRAGGPGDLGGLPRHGRQRVRDRLPHRGRHRRPADRGGLPPGAARHVVRGARLAQPRRTVAVLRRRHRPAPHRPAGRALRRPPSPGPTWCPPRLRRTADAPRT